MKRIKKVMIFLLVAVMVLSSSAMAFADNDKWEKKYEKKNEHKFKFSDQEKVPEWANEALMRMYMKGVVKGDSGAAAPNREITNAEAAAMVLRILGLEEQANADVNIKLEVEIEDEDEVPAWARGVVGWALKEGLMDKENGRFKPNHKLTRLQAAVLLVRAAKLEAEARAQTRTILPFKDAREIPYSATGYVAVAYERGFLVGFPNGTFQPNKTISRAEWAALLDRVDRKTDKFNDQRQVKGTVTEVVYGPAPTITVVTPVFPLGYPYQVDDTAVFYVDGKESTILDVYKGDQVIFQLSDARKILMVTVIRKAQDVVADYRGTVTQVVYGTNTALPSISLTTDQGILVGAPIADWAILLGPSGNQITLVGVKAGDRVEVRIQAGLVTRIKLLER